MKNISVEEFMRYRNKTGKGLIKIESHTTTVTPLGNTLQTREVIETFRGENNKLYNMHIIATEAAKGVSYSTHYNYKYGLAN